MEQLPITNIPTFTHNWWMSLSANPVQSLLIAWLVAIVITTCALAVGYERSLKLNRKTKLKL